MRGLCFTFLVRFHSSLPSCLSASVHDQEGANGFITGMAEESSLTAQPTLELHTHGSPALMELLLGILPTLGKEFRIAEPGTLSLDS